MSFLSFEFLGFLPVVLICYYIFPLKHRWIVLLTGSLLFYLLNGVQITIVVLLTALLTYRAAVAIEKEENKKKEKLVVSLVVLLLLAILTCIKAGTYLDWQFRFFLVPIGISYYTLSLIGYLLDVYWKRDVAERNFLYFVTFVFFFPKIIQGPISSHKVTGKMLIEGHKFEYERVCFGGQLLLWGVFKKLVLADRISVFVNDVFSNLPERTGIILIITMIMSALQLYCDFSGYTDMALGIAEMFGIYLEQNFHHPFFARSASEFWQRWHMTLSGWFKDYLFLPVSRSGAVKNISKRVGKKFGAAARKKTMMVISTGAVWIATGLWHGTGINYLVWGVYWGGIIIFSEIFADHMQKLNKFFHINTEAPLWKFFQMLRTSAIFVVGKMISAQKSLMDVKIILADIKEGVHMKDLQYLYEYGLKREDFQVIVLGLSLLLIISCVQERGIGIRKYISERNAVIRWIFYSLLITTVLLLGRFGVGYDVSTFAYQIF